jgi:hypothetical protein
MEKSKERRHGYATEGTMLITMADIKVMDRSVRIDGEGIGHLPGYKRSGEDLISSVCVEVADHLVLEGLLDLEERVAAFLGAVI